MTRVGDTSGATPPICCGRDVLGRSPNAAMPAGVVPLHHLGEHVHELQGVGSGQITIQAFFEGAVEPFDDRGFGIPEGGKVVNGMFFQGLLKRAIVKFFALIRLTRTTRMRPFERRSHAWAKDRPVLSLSGSTHAYLDNTSNTVNRYHVPPLCLAKRCTSTRSATH